MLYVWKDRKTDETPVNMTSLRTDKTPDGKTSFWQRTRPQTRY